jgi:hypothetical protein
MGGGGSPSDAAALWNNPESILLPLPAPTRPAPLPPPLPACLGSAGLSLQVDFLTGPEDGIKAAGFAPIGPNWAPRFSGFLISGRIFPTGVTFVFCFIASASGITELGPKMVPVDVRGPGVDGDTDTDPFSARSSDSEWLFMLSLGGFSFGLTLACCFTATFLATDAVVWTGGGCGAALALLLAAGNGAGTLAAGSLATLGAAGFFLASAGAGFAAAALAGLAWLSSALLEAAGAARTAGFGLAFSFLPLLPAFRADVELALVTVMWLLTLLALLLAAEVPICGWLFSLPRQGRGFDFLLL